MKRLVTKTRGLIKGTPSAVLLSAAIHLALIFLAGGFVVFSVIKKQEKKFVPPPPVERQKMELRKPKVKVKKKVRPQAAQRISARNVQGMTSIQLPEVSSLGVGLGVGVGGFEMMPDPSDLTLFGSKSSVAAGNDFEGTFYSLAFDRHKKLISMTEGEYTRTLRQFTASGWNPRALARFYRAPQKLYTTSFSVPLINSEHGPAYFGMGYDFVPAFWVAHYKGQISYKGNRRIRFCGFGDDVLLVRINGEVVFNGGWGGPRHAYHDVCEFRNTAEDNGRWLMVTSLMQVGDWVELEQGAVVDMEVLIGELGGGWFSALLLVQEEGEVYAKKEDGGPTLPLFKTAPVAQHLRKEIEYMLIPGEADIDGGPMFNVY